MYHNGSDLRSSEVIITVVQLLLGESIDPETHGFQLQHREILVLLRGNIMNPHLEVFDHLVPDERAILNFIFTFSDESVMDFIDEEAEWEIDYRTFDWSLNDVKRNTEQSQ